MWRNCLDKIRRNRNNIFSFTLKRYVDILKAIQQHLSGVKLHSSIIINLFQQQRHTARALAEQKQLSFGPTTSNLMRMITTMTYRHFLIFINCNVFTDRMWWKITFVFRCWYTVLVIAHTSGLRRSVLQKVNNKDCAEV